MELLQNIFVIYIIAINVLAYILMWFDKYQAKCKRARVSENTFFLLAIILGALGIYLGMKAPIYHKAAKTKFKWGIPLLFILNIVCIYLVYRYK